MTADLYGNVSAGSYHADAFGNDQPSLSCGIAKILLAKSPLHAWAEHPRLNPNYTATPESKFDLGRTVHQMLLEGIDDVDVIQADTWKTKAAKEAREESRANGRTPMLLAHYTNAVAMTEAVRRQCDNLHAEPPMLAEGKPERTLVWDDGGVLCRARIDWLHDDLSMVDDVKTTSATANPEKWGRSTLFTIGADLQVAFYLRGLRAYSGLTDIGWRFLVAETKPPYAISVVGLSAEALEVADAKVEKAIELWRGCLTDGVWPGYTKDVVLAEPRDWETDLLITDELGDIAWAQM